MAATEETLAEKLSAVEIQANTVRSLASSSAPKPDIDAAVQELNALKFEKSSMEKSLQSMPSGSITGSHSREEFRRTLKKTLEHHLFYNPSYEIYGSVAGLYDYGPSGCEVEDNIISFWRQHFVSEENMLRVKCPCVTPEVVLKASGHVEKFTDLMVKDEKTGTCHRADHLLKEYCNTKLEKDLTLSSAEVVKLKHVISTLDDFSCQELGAKIKEYGITAPETKNPLSDPYPFNLMFQTSIGPSGSAPAFMRPETAQGIFVNFNKLYHRNGNKLPFAAAQIGQAFRNEISPRQGLLRDREFTLAEIEHFLDPEDKSHPKFAEVADLEFFMFRREEQSLTAARISYKIDTTGTSIGKRYARTDEEGVPYAITVDSTTSVTIRERDSRDQVRVDVKKVVSVIRDLSEGHMTWEDVWSTFPHHSSTTAEDKGAKKLLPLYFGSLTVAIVFLLFRRYR